MNDLYVSKIEEVFGEVRISSSKNSCLAILAAVLLSDGIVILKDIPNIIDIQYQISLLKKFNISVVRKQNNLHLNVNLEKIEYIDLLDEYISEYRGSYYFMGAMLSKFKKVKIKMPGGCQLGDRNIDYHLAAFKKMNVEINQLNDDILLLSTDHLLGAEITLPYPSVGATVNIILASLGAQGKTKINNASIEPEVIDFMHFLKKMGVDIKGIGSKTVEINPINVIKGCNYKPISDRIEAFTYFMIGAFSEKGIVIKNVDKNSFDDQIKMLSKIGIKIDKMKRDYVVKKGKSIESIDIKTGPYPMFPTDFQQILVPLLCYAEGVSTIEETVFSNRFSQISELKKMGANIVLNDNVATIRHKLLHKHKEIIGKDLRGTASLLVASIYCNGDIIIKNGSILFRGYDNVIEKLRQLNVEINILK